MNMFKDSSNFTIRDSLFNTAGRDLYITTTNDSISKRFHIWQWLKAPDPTSNFIAARDKRTAGTSTWLLADGRFLEWKKNGCLLWLQGKAGSGKTFLCTAIIEELQLQSDQMPPPIYHYFDSCDSSKQTYRGFTTSLIMQIASYSHEALVHLEKLFNKYGHGLQEPSLQELETLLVQILISWSSVATTYIIIDAMDECMDQEQESRILSLVQRLLHQDQIHILVTSRHSFENISKKKIFHIMLLADNVSTDIDIYLSSAIQKLRLHQNLKSQIKQCLMGGADGQFRWVDCQVSTLLECGTPRAVQKALKSLPRTLEGIYSESLNKISSWHKEDAKCILQWLTFAFRPLSLDELQEILAVNPQTQSFMPEYQDHDLDKRLHVIVNTTLVTVTHRGIVQLAHHSVKEFLIFHHMTSHPPAFFHINKQLAHEAIAEICLIYLLHCGREATNSACSIVEKTAFPLAIYAAQYWIDHILSGKRLSPSATAQLGIQLLDISNPSYLHWLKLNQPDMKWKAPDPSLTLQQVAQPIYYAALVGILEVIQSLVEEKADVNAVGGWFGTVLQAAAQSGNEAVIHYLLASGADPNIYAYEHGSALQIAAVNGYEAVVKLLLASGAAPDARGGEYGTALHAAVASENIAIVQLLLDARADLNAQSGEYGTALHVATNTKNQTEDIIQLLLASGADPNAEDCWNVTVLQEAIVNGDKTAVQMLLAAGADPNAYGGEYGTALEAAAIMGNQALVSLLLDSGANSNASGTWDGSALQAAAAKGDINIVRLLLESGANPNSSGGLYEPALQSAAASGNKALVQLLLDSGADPNIQDDWYKPPLLAAITNRHEDVVSVLLASGADPNADGGLYKPALQAAAVTGSITIMKMLLDANADPNAQGGLYGTALQAASVCQNEAAVKLLLASGADPNISGGEYGNALQAAAANGNKSILKLLLTSGADCNGLGGLYGTALLASVLNGHEVIVQLLLDAGADPNAHSNLYKPARLAAVGKEAIEKLLLAKEAVTSIQE